MQVQVRQMSISGNTRVVLLGGPTGVGKTSILEDLRSSIPRCAVLDADDTWRVSSELGIPENRPIAISNTIAVMRGYINAGCDVGILAWVFAREELYGPIVEAMKGYGVSVMQVYLVAEERCLEARLQERGEPDRVEYAISRLRLIEKLPFDKIDTSDLAPGEVAEKVRQIIQAGN